MATIKKPWENKLKRPAGRIPNNIDAYLDKVYALNEQKIYEAAPHMAEASAKEWFKVSVERRIEFTGVSVSQALDWIANSESFINRDERRKNVVMKEIYENKEVWRAFKKVAGFRNFGEFDYNKFRYNEEDSVISYQSSGGAIYIDHDPSTQTYVFYIITPRGERRELYSGQF